MTMGNRIASLRKKMGLTQDALARKLEVTNQAVSKWESDQCCPDIQLLPKIADIFETTIDALFDREPPRTSPDLPWEDDGTLRVVLYAGRDLLGDHPAAENMEFRYEGPVLNIHSQINVRCDNVQGSVTAGGNVTCDDVGRSVSAGGDVTADSIDGSVSAGGNVCCDEINGASVTAGGSIYCDHME